LACALSSGKFKNWGYFSSMQWTFYAKKSETVTLLMLMHASLFKEECNQTFDLLHAQEQMLKKGFAWHYTAYDQRPELAKVSSTNRFDTAMPFDGSRQKNDFTV
jgi:hypothetical protein